MEKEIVAFEEGDHLRIRGTGFLWPEPVIVGDKEVQYQAIWKLSVGWPFLGEMFNARSTEAGEIDYSVRIPSAQALGDGGIVTVDVWDEYQINSIASTKVRVDGRH